MKPNKMLLILPIIAAVVLSSGCTTGGTIGGKGVAVVDFAPDISTAKSGDNVQLQLKIQNMGETDAYNVRAELAGIDVTEWGNMLGTTFTLDDASKLVGVNKEANTLGGVKTKIWQLTAPSQPKGLNNQYTPIVKVSYDYKTEATKAITIVSEDELRRILQNGGTLPVKAVVQSDGPLAVDVVTGNFEKVSNTLNSWNDNVFPVSIKITNSGGGTVVPPGTGTSFFGGSFSTSLFGNLANYPIGVRITPPSGTSFVNTGGGFSDDCTSGIVTKELWKGDTAEITCELSVNSPPAYREDRQLRVEVFYRYQTEAQTSVTVFGENNGFGSSWGGGWGWQ